MNNFLWLEQWYLDQCNGLWEHGHGVKISTIDNPGWSVSVSLRDTPYQGLPNAEMKRHYDSERDWMICSIKDGTFEGIGGPLMLGPIVQVFRNWIGTVGL